MAGKKLLLATELDRGAASTARILPLAAALADRGHDVTLALPPNHHDGAGFPVIAAPSGDIPTPPGFRAASYADLLLLAGYATTDSLRATLAGWRDILTQTRPDLLIADFAPTAMLAAHLATVPQAAIGDGYSLPPPTRPLPPLRPWADIQPADTHKSAENSQSAAAADAEGRVLAVVNALARDRERRGLGDLFAGIPSFLCTFAELDHYPGRTGAAYFGEVFPPSRGPAPTWPALTWPDATGGRVYIDLDPRHPALSGLLAAIDALGLPALIQAAKMTPATAATLARSTIATTATGNRNALLSGADIIVCQSLEIAAPALLAGKPLLMLPIFLEQVMTLHRVATQGFGHGVPPDADTASIDAALRRLVDDRECRLRAANFARLYDGYCPGIAIEAVADDIDDLLA